MVNFQEYPVHFENGKIVNPGELHVAVAVLVDTSSSVAPYVYHLMQGLKDLGAAIQEDPLAKGRVDICVITFDDTARVAIPFGSAYDYQVPEVTCNGMTAMHQAVDLGLQEIEHRKAQYRELGTPYFRPWLFLLTDGGANDSDNGAFTRLVQAQKDRHCIFYPVGIGEEADIPLLKSLNQDGLVITASKDNFKGAFRWLSDSLSKIVQSHPGEIVTLPSLIDYQLSVKS